MKWDDGLYTDEARAIATDAINRSQTIFDPLLSLVESILIDATDYEAAREKIERQLVNKEFILALSSHLAESMVTMNALGRSFIVQKDEHFSGLQERASAKFMVGKYVASAWGMNWFAAQAPNVRITFDLVPRGVLSYLQNKGLRIAGVENQEILDAIRRKLADAIERGQSYSEFRRDVKLMINSLGYSGEQPFRLHTVYTTNLFSSYTIGQLEQVNEVRDRFPYWRYRAIMDDRTRPLHRALNGKIFAIGEGPTPPIDFNCRCTMQFIHTFEAERTDLRPMSDADLGKLLGGREIVRLDNQAEFERWYDEKEAVLDARIKNIVQLG